MPKPYWTLNPRENQLISLISQGLDTEQMAVRMGLTAGGLDKLRSRTLVRVGARNSAHLVAIWHEERIRRMKVDYGYVMQENDQLKRELKRMGN